MSRTSKKSRTLIDQATEIAGQVLPPLESAADTVLHDYLPRAQDALAEAIRPSPKPTHRFRNFLLLLGLVGLAAAAAKALRSSAGRSPVTGAPAPAPAPRDEPVQTRTIPTSPVEPKQTARTPEAASAEPQAAEPPAAEPQAADPDDESIERLDTEAPTETPGAAADTVAEAVEETPVVVDESPETVPAQSIADPGETTAEIPAGSLTSFFDEVLTEGSDGKRTHEG